jgi:prepilin-type N-terminal cleavage/methylation domain-containing protein
VVKRNKIKFFVSSCLCGGKGFTLIELVVAIGVMAMVVVFAGTVFKASIGSYRIATAQAEIMQKFRAITDQLNNDFKGLRYGTPVILWFEVSNVSDDRLDQIMFFAEGDFQSVQPYDADINPPHYQIPQTTGSPVVGNVARIQYGQANIYSPTDGRYLDPNEQVFENSTDRYFNKKYRTLARRQHILTADPNIFPWPDSSNYANFVATFNETLNDAYEHDTNSLSQWQVLFNLPANQDHIMDICFHYRPRIDFQDSTGLHMLMAEGVPSFAIQVTVDDANGFDWQPTNDDIRNKTIPTLYWPRAIKFTFTLYDSQGVFKDGQTFTHIVYIGD